MLIRNSARLGDRRGFTIVELLVATAITAVMAALLISITASVMSVWNRSRGSLTTSNQVKLALDQLATDLEGAMFRHDGGVWLAATILDSNNAAASISDSNLVSRFGWSSFSGVVKPRTTGTGANPAGFVINAPDIEDCRFGRAGVWLRLFTTKQDANDPGAFRSTSAPIAVGYQLRRRRVTNSSSEHLYMLYRASVRVTRTTGTGSQSAGSFQVGYDFDPSNVAITYNIPNASAEQNPGNITNPHASQVIANNVIDFGVRLYVRENGGLRLIFPAQAATLGATPATGVPSDSSAVVPAAELSHLAVTAGSADPADAYRTRMPDVVEVMIRVLSDEGTQRVQALEAGQAPGDWWTVALEHSTVYTRRIEIAGEAP